MSECKAQQAREARSLIFYARDLEHELHDGMNWVIPGKLIAGQYLGGNTSSEKMEVMKKVGVKTIIDLTHEDDNMTVYDVPTHMTRHHFPIVDQTAYNDGAVISAATVALAAMRDTTGGVVYMHCWGGHGRTGVVVSVIVGQYLNVSADVAIYITSATHATRPYISAQGRSASPQSEMQINQARRLINHWNDEHVPLNRRLFISLHA